MSLSWRWGIAVVALLGSGGLIARAIVARQHEKATITQSAASMHHGALALRDGDVIQAMSARLVRTLPVSGSIQAVDTVLLKSRVSGELKTLRVREGDPVREGQVLGKVDAQEYRQRLEQAHQQTASAQAQWQNAQRTLETNQGLVAQGFISKNALDTSVSNAAAAKANALAAKAFEEVTRQSLDDTRLISPIKGTVSQRFAQVGERLAPESKVLEIVDLSKLEIEVALRPEDVAQVKVGTSGLVRVEGLPRPVEAHIVRISPTADPGTRTVTAYLSVKSQQALRQGLYAQGHLNLSQVDALVVPRSSVRRNASGDYVQVVRDGQIRHQVVRLGAEGLAQDDATPDASRPLVAIDAGLKPGDSVLQESTGVLTEGTRVELGRLKPSPTAPSR